MSDSDVSADAVSRDDLIRDVRVRRDKALKFEAEDDVGTLTWYVAYRGKFGWVACRGNGRWMDEPSDEDVESAVREYDNVELVERAGTPEQVTL